jgi:ABC-type glycerol-3-phosphate transport system substrate-binding protein
MKKKFMCLLLALMMISSVLLTSCAQDDTISFEETRPTQTLVIYMIAENEVSEKAEADVEEALNNLTQTKFKTKVDLRFFSEDKYYTALEATMKAKKKELNKAKKEALDKKKREKEIRDSCKEAGISYVPETTRAPSTVMTAEETLVDQEYGIIRYKYPDPEENQVDIFYVGNYDKYQQYVDEEWLARLNDEVNTTSKKLKEHIPAIYMENIQDEGIYGIPNNTVVGEYTWMLLEKNLMDRYFCTADSITSLSSANLYTFLSDVYQFERDDNGELTYLPIKGELSPTNMWYWSYDAENNKFTNEETFLKQNLPQFKIFLLHSINSPQPQSSLYNISLH